MQLLIKRQLELGLLLAPLLLFPYRFPVWAFGAAMLLMALPWLGPARRQCCQDSIIIPGEMTSCAHLGGAGDGVALPQARRVRCAEPRAVQPTRA
jgi:hypothetical protein